jgi:hypothetical protein
MCVQQWCVCLKADIAATCCTCVDEGVLRVGGRLDAYHTASDGLVQRYMAWRDYCLQDLCMACETACRKISSRIVVPD